MNHAGFFFFNMGVDVLSQLNTAKINKHMFFFLLLTLLWV